MLGKIIGGGLPVAAFGGRREMMDMSAPWAVYQAGTLSRQSARHERRASRARNAALARNVRAAGAAHGDAGRGHRRGGPRGGVPIYQTRVGSMFGVFFTDQPVSDEETSGQAIRHHRLRDVFPRDARCRGLPRPPSQFEAGFVSTAHSDGDIARAIDAATIAMQRVAAAAEPAARCGNTKLGSVVEYSSSTMQESPTTTLTVAGGVVGCNCQRCGCLHPTCGGRAISLRRDG